MAENTEKGLHHIEEDIREAWVKDWAAAGTAEMGEFLAKHAAFLTFLDLEAAPEAVE